MTFSESPNDTGVESRQATLKLMPSSSTWTIRSVPNLVAWAAVSDLEPTGSEQTLDSKATRSAANFLSNSVVEESCGEFSEEARDGSGCEDAPESGKIIPATPRNFWLVASWPKARTRDASTSKTEKSKKLERSVIFETAAEAMPLTRASRVERCPRGARSERDSICSETNSEKSDFVGLVTANPMRRSATRAGTIHFGAELGRTGERSDPQCLHLTATARICSPQ